MHMYVPATLSSNDRMYSTTYLRYVPRMGRHQWQEPVCTFVRHSEAEAGYRYCYVRAYNFPAVMNQRMILLQNTRTFHLPILTQLN